jgi:hypothetical protein
MEQAWQQYGLLGVIAWMIIKDVWPWLRKRVDKSQDNEAEMRKAELARDAAREERMLRALESMADSSNGILRLLSTVDVRLGIIERHLDLPTPEPDPAGRRRKGAG